MVRKRTYTHDEVEEFIETAQNMGVGPAIRHLGYPSWPTAAKWFRDNDLELPTVDSLQARAAELRDFYGDTEKKYAAQRAVERIVEALEQDRLTADDINKLNNALHTAIKTFNLIDGKSTSITETHTKDEVDLGVFDIINTAKARNALKEEII